jgi:outer membrane lipoprotein-sorting protein
MRRRTILIIAVAAVLVVASLAIGLVQSRAQGAADLPALTPSQLLTKVAQSAPSVPAVSGTVAWTNNLTGLELLSLASQASPGLSSLLDGGTGQVWVAKDKARLEVPGQGGNTVLVVSGTSAWVYVPSANTATEYTFPTESQSQQALPDPSAKIAAMIEKLAPTATLAVSGQETVAGQACYILTLTPTAPNTVFASFKVDVDGNTFLPLRAQVLAKGSDQAVLSLGFTAVSYDAIPDGTFAYQPPVGATVEHKPVTLPSGASDGSAAETTHAAPQPLSVDDAAAKAGFPVLSYQGTDTALPFQGAYVVPAFDAPMIDPASLIGGRLFGQGASALIPSTTSSPDSGQTMSVGPIVAMRYGQGFGTVALVELKPSAQQSAQLTQLLGLVPGLTSTTVDGAPVYQFATQLGSAALWQKGDLVLIAVGSVSQTDLLSFVSSVR